MANEGCDSATVAKTDSEDGWAGFDPGRLAKTMRCTAHGHETLRRRRRRRRLWCAIDDNETEVGLDVIPGPSSPENAMYSTTRVTRRWQD